MPRRKIPLISDNFYHVFNRGIDKQTIFFKDSDYLRMLNTIKFYNFKNNKLKFSTFLRLTPAAQNDFWRILSSYENLVDIVAYCLMPNHFHLLIKQNSENGVSKLLSNLQNSYTRYFNTKNDRVGHLFESQFKSKIIQSDEILSHISRYIHLNPYTSNIAKTINENDTYKWSSLKEYISEFSNKDPQPDSRGIFSQAYFASAESLRNKTSLLSPTSLRSGYFTKGDKLCKTSYLINKGMFNNTEIYLKFIHDNADYQKGLHDLKNLTLD